MSTLSEEQKRIVNVGYQFSWSQHIHDRAFHQDIDCLNPKEKYSHFAHHIAKYTPSLVDGDGDVNYRVLADLLIITTSMKNAIRMNSKELWSNVLTRDNSTGMKYKPMTIESAEIDTLKFMARKSAELGKACESLDHIENFATGPAIRNVITDICVFIHGLWTQYLAKPIDELFELALNRLLAVEMAHPFYLRIKKQQHDSQLGKAIETYTNLPVRCNELLKQLMDCSKGLDSPWNLFSRGTLRMVIDLPVLLTLEERKLIMREMSGIFTVTALGREHLENII